MRKSELKAARKGDDERRTNGGKKQTRMAPGEQSIDKCLQLMGIRVMRAPEGMKRRKENTTNWSKNQKCINWQVEFFREGNDERFMARAMGNKTLSEAYDDACEIERRENLTDVELKALKKRKAEQQKLRDKATKRIKLSSSDTSSPSSSPISTESILQNPQTSAWNSSQSQPESQNLEPARERIYSQGKSFYLLRPYTPSSMPKVLVQLDATKPLSELLQRRAVLEYPTIYTFQETTPLPDEFMLEKDFLKATGQPAFNPSEEESSGVEGEESDTSSSGDSDSSSEDGEISE